jgi:hypothetical protein
MNAWRVVELLGILAEESRYGIVAMLVQAGEDGLPQGRLLARSGLALPRLKRHLAKLVKAGLIRRNHRRKGVVWKVDARQLGDLVQSLTLKLQPQQLEKPGAVFEIEAPKRFRSLASKLNCVSPAEARGVGAKRRALAAPAVPVERRLPVRLTEAIALESPDGIAAAGTEPEPARPSAPVAQGTNPATAVRPVGHGRMRRHPIRLSEAIGDLSG